MGGLAPFYPNGGTVGGESSLLDVSSRSCLIYEVGLESPEVYVHELGHVMGCLHFFEDKGTMDSIENGISVYENNLFKYVDAIKSIKDHLNSNTGAVTPGMVSKLNTDLIQYDTKIKELMEKLDQISVFKGDNAYFFSNCNESSNFMDYSPNGRLDFFKWQWAALFKEVVNYYS